MIGSTLTLATGMTFLIAVRLSGNPGGLGVVVLVGLVIVAIGCALHLTALIGRTRLARGVRVGLTGACWLVLALGTGWVVERAPGPELLVALVIVPPIVGVIGLFAIRTDRWPAVAFLAMSLVLSAVLAPVWLGRQG